MNKDLVIVGDFVNGVYGMSRVVDVSGNALYLEDHTVVNSSAVHPVVITEDLLKSIGYTQSDKREAEFCKEYDNEDTEQVFKISIIVNDKYDDVRILRIQAKYKQDKRYEHGLVTNVKYLHNLQHILSAFGLRETFDYE